MTSTQAATNSTTDPARSFDELLEIADSIEPLEVAWKKAWRAVAGPNPADDVERAIEDFVEAVAAINVALEKRVDDIARITKNSSSNIRSFAPKDTWDCWFSGGGSPSDYLRNVAKYKSFNTTYWGDQQVADDMKRLRGLVSDKKPTSAALAAEAILHGEVPHVLEEDTKRAHGLSKFEKALLAAGILEHYQPRIDTWVSAKQSFAFVVHESDPKGHEAQEFNFWPKNRSTSAIIRSSLESGPGIDLPAVAGTTQLSTRTPRPR